MQKLTLAGFMALWMVASLLAPAAATETVSLKGKKKSIFGEVIKITPDSVTLENRSKTTEIPSGQIESIKWTGEPAIMNVARNSERAGQLERALKGYQEAKNDPDAKSPLPGLRADLDFGIAATTAKLALAGTGDADPAIKGLEAFRERHPESFHTYSAVDLLGRLYARKQDWKNATAAFDLLGQSKQSEHQMASKIGRAELFLKQGGGDPVKAASEFDAVLQMPAKTPGERSRQLDARFGKIACQIEQKQFEQALKNLNQIVDDPAITENSAVARAYILQGKCHIAAGNDDAAVLDFLKVDLMLPNEKPSHAEALYHLSQLRTGNWNPSRAENARKRLESRYPNSPWAKR